MQFVQIVLTDDQVATLAGLTKVAIEQSADGEAVIDLPEGFEQLSEALHDVVLRPSAYPVTGRTAETIKRVARKVKGPAQPASSRNKRTARQAARQGGAKERRQQRKFEAEQFNNAREVYEREAEEMAMLAQQDEARARQILAEASDETLELLELMGAKTAADLGRSLRLESGRFAAEAGDKALGLILPGKVEKALQRERAN